MSATGRGAERSKCDYYPTPASAVQHLLSEVQLPGGKWLEPGAGDGSIIRAVNRLRTDVSWTAIELQEQMRKPLVATRADRVVIANFLRWDFGRRPSDRFDVGIGNPPFTHAARFVRQTLQWADQAVMLLRLNWLGSSRGRRHLFESAGTPDVFVLAQRPSFDTFGTDACDYGWMRWHRDGSQKGTVKILWGDR